MVENTPDLASYLEQIKTVATRHGYYPDGTLLIEGGNSADRVWDLILRNGLLDCGIWQPHGFRGIEPFSRNIYRLYYTTDYRERLGELDFGVIFPAICSHPTKDYELDNLLITVGFNRKPSEDVRHRFAISLGEWFRLVRQQGMFGEGPIEKVSNEVEFRGRVAQFRVNASRSGQDTLNWLLLSVLNFGYAVSQVSNLIFNQEKNLDFFIDRRLDTKLERLSIPTLNRLGESREKPY